MDCKKEMIIVVVNDGFSSEVLKYANEICNVSAIILNGRGSTESEEGDAKQTYSEKETIILTVEREDKNKIMESISNHLGLGSNAQGIIFSLPVVDYACVKRKQDEMNECCERQNENED